MDQTSVGSASSVRRRLEQTSAVSPGAPPPAAYPFLQPPQEPGELGRLGGYRVLRLLGEGGMGVVFEAADTTLHRSVALKVMKPVPGLDGEEATQRFLREARAMAAIKHDNLVTVYQAGREGDAVYLAMDLLAGETLEERLRRPEPVPPADAVRIGREVATGLAAIHQRGLIHRDIKPANLWLEAPGGRVKILDFGLARGVDDTHLTREGMVVGTPAYLSPEQARGRGTDFRSDLFSLGCVLYRVCAGAVAFPASDTLSQLVAVAADDPVPLRKANPKVPPPLADLIHRLLAKDPADRPASAEAVAKELQAIEHAPRGRTVVTAQLAETARVVPPRPAARKEPTPRKEPTRRVAKRPSRKTAAHRPLVRWLVLGGAILLAAVSAVGIHRALRKPPADTAANTPPAPAPSPPPAATPTGEKVFLTDLEPVAKVNWPFRPGGGGKKGLPPPKGDRPGAKGGQPPQTDMEVVVNGVRSPHGLFFHGSPPHDPPTSLSYKLDGKYRTFTTEVAGNDSAWGDWPPMTFAVYGDGRELWRSRPVQSRDDAQACSVPVAGVGVLKLEMTVPGEIAGSHGAWLEPHLTR